MRRDLTTGGLPLGRLVGREFRVDEVALPGGRPNMPRRHPGDLLGKPVFEPLFHRTGSTAAS